MTDFLSEFGMVDVTVGLCLLGGLVKGMLSHTYTRLVRASRDIGHSRHRLMKNLCNKFNTCYQLKIGVPDVPVFVEKYLRHYTLLGVRLRVWEALGQFLMLASMILSFGGAVCSMAWNLNADIVYATLFAGIMGNGMLLLIDCLFHLSEKKDLLRVDIVDYLENVYKPRLENETFHPEIVEKYQQEYFEPEVEPDRQGKVVNLMPRELESREPVPVEFTKEEEKIIRDVLREYM